MWAITRFWCWQSTISLSPLISFKFKVQMLMEKGGSQGHLNALLLMAMYSGPDGCPQIRRLFVSQKYCHNLYRLNGYHFYAS